MTDTNKEVPINGMKVKPYGYPAMKEAWSVCLSWAISHDNMRMQFKAETGFDIDSLINASALCRMINEGTGYERDVFIAWCDWVTENVWGVDDQEVEKE
jgi:hypothetical protein